MDTQAPMVYRELRRVIPGQPAEDGAGVKLRRSLGATPHARVDPLLMLDEFYTDRPEDYLAGFPAHPHRGFETVTYMLEGRMLHQDHLGHRGELGPGGVQWMTAGRGIIHSEMPMQQSGRMRGFQLWVNLPGRLKMQPAAYRDVPADAIPQLTDACGHGLRLLRGRLHFAGEWRSGPSYPGESSTEVLYADLCIQPGTPLTLELPASHEVVLYPHTGDLRIAHGPQRLMRGNAGVLGSGTHVQLHAAGDTPTHTLLIAARALHEPVAQYGPFVMNTREELEQALADYRDGRLTGEPATVAR